MKYHKPENSEFWDFYPNGKITTIFFVVVCKMPLKLYIYFILCMLIYLVFNNLTIIFQVPRLLHWQFPGPLPRVPVPLGSASLSAATNLRWLYDPSVIHCLSTFPRIFHDQSATGGGLYGQDVGVNFVRSTL